MKSDEAISFLKRRQIWHGLLFFALVPPRPHGLGNAVLFLLGLGHVGVRHGGYEVLASLSMSVPMSVTSSSHNPSDSRYCLPV
jgi:hypothetical protein